MAILGSGHKLSSETQGHLIVQPLPLVQFYKTCYYYKTRTSFITDTSNMQLLRCLPDFYAAP